MPLMYRSTCKYWQDGSRGVLALKLFADFYYAALALSSHVLAGNKIHGNNALFDRYFRVQMGKFTKAINITLGRVGFYHLT